MVLINAFLTIQNIRMKQNEGFSHWHSGFPYSEQPAAKGLIAVAMAVRSRTRFMASKGSPTERSATHQRQRASKEATQEGHSCCIMNSGLAHTQRPRLVCSALSKKRQRAGLFLSAPERVFLIGFGKLIMHGP